MRVQNSDLRRDNANRRVVDESKRRDLKRLAAFACAVVLGSTLFSAGCQTTSGSKKDPKTVDDFLAADKPKW